MTSHRFLTPLVGLALLAGAGSAAYRTRDKWVPYVFPPKADAKAGGGDGHGHEHGPDGEHLDAEGVTAVATDMLRRAPA